MLGEAADDREAWYGRPLRPLHSARARSSLLAALIIIIRARALTECEDLIEIVMFIIIIIIPKRISLIWGPYHIQKLTKLCTCINIP